VTPSSAVRDRGAYIDSGLTMQSHVRPTVSRCFAVLRQLRTVRRQVPTSVFQSLIVALVLSRLDYCNSVLFGLPANLIQRLQSVQNAAARLTFRFRRSEHITPALVSLHWLRIPDLLQTVSYDIWIHPRHLSVLPTVMFHPFVSTVSKWAFRATILNDLPLHVASAPSLAVFRQRLRVYLSIFPFLPRHYHITRVLLSPFITTVWTPVVLAIINII